ncbi:MAG: flagellar hook-length control protein FliK [Planctomycetota bacterium]|nr:flagellar hook-length control protein FliK [Planctomycetota bacterium]
MRFAIRRGISQVTVDLSPPELGRVNVRLEMRQGVVSALIQVEKAEARHLLMSGVDLLRQNLQVQGVELDFFDVYLGNQGNGGGNGDWTMPAFTPSSSETLRSESEQSAAVEGMSLTMAAVAGAGRVDVVV